MTQVGQWSRRIVGGALVLAFAGLLGPAITSARFNDEIVGEEVIEIEGEAPWEAPNYDGHTGTGAPNSYPSGGDGGSWDGPGVYPSGGGSDSGEDEPGVCHDYCIFGQLESHCRDEYGGTFYITDYHELDADGEVENSFEVGYCHIETPHGWMQVWYHDVMHGSGDDRWEPTEICSGEPGETGTCFAP
jgi:hypothetical protein